MTFALTVSHLIDVMGQPGCPICRMEYEAAEQSVASFLWENVNDPNVRQAIFASYGFCPDHTRLLVAKERMESGTVLGVNIVYEHLARFVAQEIHSFEQKEKVTGRLARVLQKLGIRPRKPVVDTFLPPQGLCPICISSHQAALNALSDLCAELEKKTSDVQTAYLASDGLCLDHLRQGIGHFGRLHPVASHLLLDDTCHRLEMQSSLMKEYIRKNNWEYRKEKITHAESLAWGKTLTFLTGLPGDRFTHKVEPF